MHIFVKTVNGPTIEGKVYFKGGAAAQDVDVMCDRPGGRADRRDAHQRRRAVHAGGQISLRPYARGTDRPTATSRASPKSSRRRNYRPSCRLRGDSMPVLKAADTPDADAAVSSRSLEALQAQLDQVREQLDRMENTTRLRDILGGIGYILGLSGIAFYLLALRPKTP